MSRGHGDHGKQSESTTRKSGWSVMCSCDGLVGCQAGVCGRGVTDMMMVKTPKQGLDEGI